MSHFVRSEPYYLKKSTHRRNVGSSPAVVDFILGVKYFSLTAQDGNAVQAPSTSFSPVPASSLTGPRILVPDSESSKDLVPESVLVLSQWAKSLYTVNLLKLTNCRWPLAP